MPVSSSTAIQAPVRFFVFMGVCGVGKSTIAEAVAESLPARCIEADNFHSADNIEAMSRGMALTNEQRRPWIAAVCEAALTASKADDKAVVIACSALKRRYRDCMREAMTNPLFLYLHGPKEVIYRRLTERTSHFMPAAMLDSQLRDLEPPVDEADACAIDIARPFVAVVAEALTICRKYAAGDGPALIRNAKTGDENSA